ncbi:hypothetical protein Tco_1262149 [Tanacetum coccineum]
MWSEFRPNNRSSPSCAVTDPQRQLSVPCITHSRLFVAHTICLALRPQLVPVAPTPPPNPKCPPSIRGAVRHVQESIREAQLEVEIPKNFHEFLKLKGMTTWFIKLGLSEVGLLLFTPVRSTCSFVNTVFNFHHRKVEFEVHLYETPLGVVITFNSPSGLAIGVARKRTETRVAAWFGIYDFGFWFLFNVSDWCLVVVLHGRGIPACRIGFAIGGGRVTGRETIRYEVGTPSSATSDETAGLEEFVLTLETMALLRD